MSIRNFIGTSSALLLAWLGATYFHKIPTERYPTQGKLSASVSAKPIQVPEKIVASASFQKTESR